MVHQAIDPADLKTLAAGSVVRLNSSCGLHSAGEIGLVVEQARRGSVRYLVMFPGDPVSVRPRARDLEVLQGSSTTWWLRTDARAVGFPPEYEWGVQTKEYTDSDWGKPETLLLATRWDSLSPAYTEETARERVEQYNSGPAGPDFARVVRRAVGRWVPC